MTVAGARVRTAGLLSLDLEVSDEQAHFWLTWNKLYSREHEGQTDKDAEKGRRGERRCCFDKRGPYSREGESVNRRCRTDHPRHERQACLNK